jgi:hypothetical protein
MVFKRKTFNVLSIHVFNPFAREMGAKDIMFPIPVNSLKWAILLFFQA